MNGELLAFALGSGLAVAFAVAMLFQKSPVKSVLSLVLTFFGLAILSVLLAAPFIAVLQVIVYAGAILVLFLFVIMLLNLTEEAEERETRSVHRFLSLVGVVALGGMLLGLTLKAPAPPVPPSGTPAIPAAGGDEVPLLGRLLFTDYLLAFEVLSVLLLLAAVGALLLSKRRFE